LAKKTTATVLAGVAVAVLAGAGVAAVIRYRQGHQPHPEEADHLDELDARLSEIEATDTSGAPPRLVKIVQNLERNQGISVARLRRWITGLRKGELSEEQATAAESDFDALEREADQGGA
jgi:hypothetical protein